MANRYFFDKRDWKRRFSKYGVIFLLSFFPLVLFNIYCSDFLKHKWLVILVDCIILLVFVGIGNVIANRVFDKKDRKLERLRKDREEMEARKQKIMQDSYKKKREEKQKLKSEKMDNETNNSKVTKTKRTTRRK